MDHNFKYRLQIYRTFPRNILFVVIYSNSYWAAGMDFIFVISSRGQQTLSKKGQRVNTSGFANHSVSLATPQSACPRESPPEAECKGAWPCANKTLFMDTKMEFHIIFMLYYSSFDFFQPF